MDTSFIQILLLLFLSYTVAPTVLIRFVRIGAIFRAPRGGGRVTLTFDDGPDPFYTPQILRILRDHQVKACFFVVGSKARAHPELVRQIVDAGHEIGNHGFQHKPVWLLGPVSTARDIIDTNRTIEEFTGQKVRYCRPAWGLFNLFSIVYYRLKGLKVVLWTFMSWDWTKGTTSESITSKVLNRVRDGAILILHDSDKTAGATRGSPAHVIEALPAILRGLRQKGLRLVPLEEFTMTKHRPTFKSCFRRVWGVYDWTIRKLSGIRDLQEGTSSCFRIALRRYRGKDWPMPDGSVLQAGETYMEIHINNERLLDTIGDNVRVERAALIALREVRSELPIIARLLESDNRYRHIKVLLAITLLHRGTERLGFTAYDMPKGLLRTLIGWYERWMLGLYHPGGFKKLGDYRDKLVPKYIVMTRQDLLQRYPPAGLGVRELNVGCET
ncbi:MAG TPA: polysaccharide deacetylase family protein [Pelotomaculum sp.]|nr:polysaccharide deacetylase family protein [Pelotomaculum sp.]